MYNRYIPQSDGSYRRSRVPEPNNPPQPPHPEPAPVPQPTPPPSCPPKREPSAPRPRKDKPPISKQDGNALGFLKQLLPKNFDTGDLLIVLLLLIMAGDGDDQNTALLTLALYFLM